MTYVEGRFASPRAKRRALILLAVLTVGSFLNGAFRDVEFRWPWGRTTTAPLQPFAPAAPEPSLTAQTPVVAAAPEEKAEPKAETPEPKTEAAEPGPAPVEITPPPVEAQPTPAPPPAATPAPEPAPTTPEDPPI